MSFLEAGSDDFCGKELKKYFFFVASAAVMILIGTYWYMNYYAKGVGVDLKNAHIDYPGTPAGVVNPITPKRAIAGKPGVNNSINTPQARAGLQVTPVAAMPVKGGFAGVASQLKKSVVNVNVARGAVQTPAAAAGQKPTATPPGGVQFANPFTGRTLESIGSGVVVREDGYILTNYHVVQSGSLVNVTVFDDFGTERYRAEVVKLDEMLDLALLKISPKNRLTAARLGDSNRVQVADPVLAIGSPFGLDQTVSQGVVSGTRKSLVIDGVTHNNLMQTDAAINQGNSGGPLVDGNGFVVGINTAIYSPTGAFAGIGFAIPSNQAVQFIKDEIDLRTVVWGQGGVAGPTGMNVAAVQGQQKTAPPIMQGVAAPHTDGRETMECSSCHQVLASSQAAGRPVAGMAFATQRTPGQGQVASPYASTPQQMPPYTPGPPQTNSYASIPTQQGPAIAAGTPAPHRDGRETMPCNQCHQILNANAPVAFQFAQPPTGLGMNVAAMGGGAVDGPRVMGATIIPIDQLLSNSLGQPVGKGVFISAVVPGSPMDKSGIRAGDVLLKLDGRRLRSPRQLIRRLGEVPNGDTVRFGVMRNGERSNIYVPVLAMSMPPGMAAVPQTQNQKPIPKEFNWRGMEMKLQAPANPNLTVPKGALVEEVAGGSQASKAGIQANDVIIMIDALPVDTAERLDEAVRALGAMQPVWLKVSRNGREIFLKLS